MKRTSPFVLSLLLASGQAIKLAGSGPEGYKAVDDEAEKVHVLDLGMNTMSNSPKGSAAPETIGEFAFPGIRTAYYAQTGSQPTYDQQNGLWRQSLVQTERKHKADPISPESMDPWVYKFTKDNTNVHTQWHMDENVNQGQQEKWYSSAQKNKHNKHHNKHHKRPDVAERGMDEEVHGFVADGLPPLTEWEHTKSPFIPNGSDAAAFEGAAFNQNKHHRKHHKKDIGERGYDEEVQQFVKEYIPPLNTRVRSTMPFVPNGSDDKAFKGVEGGMAGYANSENVGDWIATKQDKKHHNKHHKKDIGERGYDEEVQQFVKEYIPPLNVRNRATEPVFVPNGSDSSAFDGAAFNQKKHHSKHHKKDVAERGMDEEVHGFVWHALPPLNTFERSKDPFVPNGSDPSAFEGAAFNQKRHHHKHHKRPDVAERNMDEEVHGFVADSLPPLTEWEHTKSPFIPNGSDSAAFDGAAFSQQKHKHNKKDNFIGERGYDTDVQQFTYNTIHNPLTSSERDWYAASVPFIPNGSQNKYPGSFAQAYAKPDIAERGMDESWVHPYSNNMDVVEGTPYPSTRPYLPYPTNGGSNVYAQQEAAPAGKTDIANKEVRPDVYVHVHKMLNPVAMGRFIEPRPKEEPEVKTWDDGPAPKAKPEPEFKFVKPEEPDEEELKEKKEKTAAENKAKAKKAKKEQDELDAKPDEEAAGVTPEKKEAPKETEEQKKKAEDDKKADEKASEEAEKKEKEEDESKAKAKKEAEKVQGKDKKKEAEAEAEALAQVKAKADGDKKKKDGEDAPAEPEKVHILEPHEYKEKADTNTPNIRTTFYGKKESKKAQI